MQARGPESEEARLEALYPCGAPEAPPKGERVVVGRLAAKACEAPISLLLLADQARKGGVEHGALRPLLEQVPVGTYVGWLDLAAPAAHQPGRRGPQIEIGARLEATSACRSRQARRSASRSWSPT